MNTPARHRLLLAVACLLLFALTASVGSPLSNGCRLAQHVAKAEAGMPSLDLVDALRVPAVHAAARPAPVASPHLVVQSASAWLSADRTPVSTADLAHPLSAPVLRTQPLRI